MLTKSLFVMNQMYLSKIERYSNCIWSCQSFGECFRIPFLDKLLLVLIVVACHVQDYKDPYLSPLLSYHYFKKVSELKNKYWNTKFYDKNKCISFVILCQCTTYLPSCGGLVPDNVLTNTSRLNWLSFIHSLIKQHWWRFDSKGF